MPSSSANTVSKDDIAYLTNLVDEARFHLYNTCPFWALIAERLTISCSRNTPTADITQNCYLRMNPDFVRSMSTMQFAVLLAHEIGHVAFRHFHRRGSRDPFRWNVAGDYCINYLLGESFGVKHLPTGGLYDRIYANNDTEEVYELLPPDVKTQYVLLDLNLTGEGSPLEGDGGDGETVGDVVVAEARLAPPEDGREQEWNDILSGAMQQSKMQGNAPAGLVRAITKHLKPRLNWLDLLKQKVRQAVSIDDRENFTWMRPNRRFIYKDLVFPSLIGYEPPKIAVAVDTSGSMMQQEISQAMAEIEGIRKQFKAKVYLMDCDAACHSGGWILPHQSLPKLKGGGGTDFRPVFEHLNKMRVHPNIVVFFTDGYGAFPTEEPDYETLWVWTEMNSPHNPPFGDTCCMKL
jgi:predicted metal-dependent peptidase